MWGYWAFKLSLTAYALVFVANGAQNSILTRFMTLNRMRVYSNEVKPPFLGSYSRSKGGVGISIQLQHISAFEEPSDCAHILCRRCHSFIPSLPFSAVCPTLRKALFFALAWFLARCLFSQSVRDWKCLHHIDIIIQQCIKDNKMF